MSAAERAVEALEAALIAQDADAAAELFGADGILELGPPDTHLVGSPAIRAYCRNLFSAFPNLGLRVVGRYRDGTAVIDEMTVSQGRQAVIGVFDARDGVIQRASFYSSSSFQGGFAP